MIYIEDKKKEKIINAALNEFALNRFKNASTDRIVENGNVSKGLLFYHFKNKRSLFEYLIKFSFEFIVNEYIDKIDMTEKDCIKRYYQQFEIKLNAYAKNKHVFLFLFSVHKHEGDNINIQNLIDTRKKIDNMTYVKLHAGVDLSLFREDILPEYIFHYIRWICEGYEKHLFSKTTIEWKNEMKVQKMVLDDLEKIFYRR